MQKKNKQRRSKTKQQQNAATDGEEYIFNRQQNNKQKQRNKTKQTNKAIAGSNWQVLCTTKKTLNKTKTKLLNLQPYFIYFFKISLHISYSYSHDMMIFALKHIMYKEC